MNSGEFIACLNSHKLHNCAFFSFVINHPFLPPPHLLNPVRLGMLNIVIRCFLNLGGHTMNVRVLTFFALMVSMVGISNAAKLPSPTKLLPKPVVFISLEELDLKVFELIEFNKKMQSLIELNAHDYCDAHNEGSHKIREKIEIASTAIAKCLGASAVQRSSFLITDPKYDITQRVIDQLNKEYLAKLSKK